MNNFKPISYKTINRFLPDGLHLDKGRWYFECLYGFEKIYLKSGHLFMSLIRDDNIVIGGIIYNLDGSEWLKFGESENKKDVIPKREKIKEGLIYKKRGF